VPHPNKVCWLIEDWAERYDSPNASGMRISDSARGAEIRRMLEESDRECLGGLRRFFAGTSSIREWVKIRSGLDADVLPSPTSNVEWDKTVSRILF
jgi:hypothetical protein